MESYDTFFDAIMKDLTDAENLIPTDRGAASSKFLSAQNAIAHHKNFLERNTEKNAEIEKKVQAVQIAFTRAVRAQQEADGTKAPGYYKEEEKSTT